MKVSTHIRNQRGAVDLILLAVFAILIAIAGWAIYQRQQEAQKTTFFDDVTRAKAKSAEYLYATQSGKTTVVYKATFKNSQPVKLFEFDTIPDINKAGSYATSEYAISHDGTQLAFVAADGLKLYGLNSKNTTVLIAASSISGSALVTAYQPKWAEPLMAGVYTVTPSWSADDQYIGLQQGLYEGSSQGVYDLAHKKYTKFGSYGHFVWAPTGHTGVTAGSSYVGDGGIAMFDASNPGKITDIKPKLNLPTGDDINYVTYTGDGSHLITQTVNMGTSKSVVISSSIDGTNPQRLGTISSDNELLLATNDYAYFRLGGNVQERKLSNLGDYRDGVGGMEGSGNIYVKILGRHNLSFEIYTYRDYPDTTNTAVFTIYNTSQKATSKMVEANNITKKIIGTIGIK